MIPYVISEAYPDYKCPSVEHDFGIVEEQEMETYFLDKISNFVLDRTGDDDLNLQDINDFFDNYFQEYFMMNPPWSAMVFRNGEWENVTPSNDKIWGHIQLIKLHEKENMEKQEIKENNEKEEYNEKKENINEPDKEYQLEEEEKLILVKIRKFFEEMLKEKPLTPQHIESLEKLTDLDRLSALFNIYLTPDNYNKNKYLFQGFLNLCIKFIQKEIELITKKMETDDSKELYEKLEYALAVYSNSVSIKQAFNF